MLWQERVEPDESINVRIPFEQSRPLQTRERDSSLALLCKELPELSFAFGRLGQETSVSDLSNISRVEIDPDGEAVAELIQPSCAPLSLRSRPAFAAQ